MGGLAAGPVGTPATVSGHRLRRRTQTVVNYVEDAYLRDDVCCGSALCASCVPRPVRPPRASRGRVPLPRARRGRAGGVPRISSRARARDVVLLASEAKAAHALGDARVSRAIRAVWRPPRPASNSSPTTTAAPPPSSTRRDAARSFDRSPSTRSVILRRRRRARPPGPPRRRVVRLARRPRRLPGRRPLRHHPTGPTRRRRFDRRGGFTSCAENAYRVWVPRRRPATTRLYESIVSAREEGAEEGAACLKGAEFRRSRRRVAFAPHLIRRRRWRMDSPPGSCSRARFASRRARRTRRWCLRAEAA